MARPPRTSARLLHEPAPARRRRAAPRRAALRAGPRRGRDRRPRRRRRSRGRIRGGQGGDALGGRHSRRGAGKDVDLGRPHPLHGAVARLRARRAAARGGRLAAGARVRRADCEPRSGDPAHAASRGPRAPARPLLRRAHDRRGRGADRGRPGSRRGSRRRPVRAPAARRGRRAVREPLGNDALWLSSR